MDYKIKLESELFSNIDPFVSESEIAFCSGYIKKKFFF